MKSDSAEEFFLLRCHVVFWKWTDISEERVASIFRVEEYAMQETSVKAGGKQSQKIQLFIITITRTSNPTHFPIHPHGVALSLAEVWLQIRLLSFWSTLVQCNFHIKLKPSTNIKLLKTEELQCNHYIWWKGNIIAKYYTELVTSVTSIFQCVDYHN
jgi:hypothetical protein